MPILGVNKKANFDYKITDIYEAGIVLFGHEVKAVRNKHISLKGAFITLKKNEKGNPELWLTNAHISLYKKASKLDDYDPERSRKLLIRKEELKRLVGKKQEQGLTLVPIKLYTKHSLIKVEFGIGYGKKKYDKREDIKKRDINKQIRTLTKQINQG
ncbi:MAG: SsrA-binding protein SmpB [Candidatus Magasanikbacteria bacterium]|nr:SsrA-binding protein SmpB [Candidatus Magasanikbacteria bacterium]